MAHVWTLPPEGSVKVNVHGATPFIPYQNGNTIGLRMIIRNCEGDLLKLSSGVVPGLTPLQNQLRAIHHGMVKAFDDNYKNMVIETDNHEAFIAIKNFPEYATAKTKELISLILSWLYDKRWVCSICYVFPGRIGLAMYLARLGGERCNQLYTFTRPIGVVEELLNRELGFGTNSPIYKDVVISNNDPDPIDFGPISLPASGVIHGGYAFNEDFFSVYNETTSSPVVVPVHHVMQEVTLIITSFVPDQFADNVVEEMIF